MNNQPSSINQHPPQPDQPRYPFQARIHKLFNLVDDNVNSIFEKVFLCEKKTLDQISCQINNNVKIFGIVGQWEMIEKEIQKWGKSQFDKNSQKEQQSLQCPNNQVYIKMPDNPTLTSSKSSLYILTILSNSKSSVPLTTSTVFLLLPMAQSLLLSKPYDQNSLIYLLLRFMGDLCNDIMVLYSQQIWKSFIENNNPYSIANGMSAQMSYKKRGLDDVAVRELEIEGWEQIKGGKWKWANGGNWVISSSSSMQKMRKIVQKSIRFVGQGFKQREKKLQIWVKLVKGDWIQVEVIGGMIEISQQLKKLSSDCQQYLQSLHKSYFGEIKKFVVSCISQIGQHKNRNIILGQQKREQMFQKVLCVILQYYEICKYKNGMYEQNVLYDNVCRILFEMINELQVCQKQRQQKFFYDVVQKQFSDFMDNRNVMNEQYNQYLNNLIISDGFKMLEFVIEANNQQNSYFEVSRLCSNKIQKDGKIFGIGFKQEDIVKVGVEDIKKVANLKSFTIENVLVYKAKLVMQSMLALVSISYPSSALNSENKKVTEHIFILLDQNRPRQISRLTESQIFFTFNEVSKKCYVLLKQKRKLNTFKLDDFYRSYNEQKYDLSEWNDIKQIISYSVSYIKQQLFYFIDQNYQLHCFNLTLGKRNAVFTDFVYDDDGEDGEESRIGEKIVFQGIDKKNGKYSHVQAFAFNGMLALGGCGRLDIFGVAADGKLSLRKFIPVQEQFSLSTLIDDHNEYLTIYQSLRQKPRTFIFQNMTSESFLKQTSKVLFEGNPIVDIFYEAKRRFGEYTGFTCLKKAGGQKKEIRLHHVIPEGQKVNKKNKIEKYLDMEELEGHKSLFYFNSQSWKIFTTSQFGLILQKQTLLREIQTRIPIQICSVDSGNLYPIRDGLYIDNFQNKLSVTERSIKMRFGIAQTLLGLQPEKKTVVVSVMGPQSLGKSYLLNRMFGTRFTVASCRTTIGIWISVVRFQKMNVMVMDCEGLFSISRDSNEQQKLVKVLTSISDFTILNQGKGLTSKNLTELMRNLTCSIKDDGQRSKQLYNGQLMMVIRDVVAGQNEQLIDEVKNTWILPEMKSFLKGFFGENDGFSVNFLPSYLSTQDFSQKVNKLKQTILQKGELLGRSSVMILKLLKIVLSQLAFDDGKKIKEFIDKINIEGLEQSFRNAWRKGQQQRVFSCQIIDDFTYCFKHRGVFIGQNEFNVDTNFINEVFSINLICQDFQKSFAKSGYKINSSNFNHVFGQFNKWLISFFNERYGYAKDVLDDEFKAFQKESMNELYLSNIERMKRQVLKQKQQLQLCLQICGDCNLLCVKRKGHKKRVTKKRDNFKEEKRAYEQYLVNNQLSYEEDKLDLKVLKERKDEWKRQSMQLKDICQIFQKIKKLQLDNSNGQLRVSEIEGKNEGIRKMFMIGGPLRQYKQKVFKLKQLFELLQNFNGFCQQGNIKDQTDFAEINTILNRIGKESSLQQVTLEIDNVRKIFESIIDLKAVVCARFQSQRSIYENQKRQYEYSLKTHEQTKLKFQKSNIDNEEQKEAMEKQRNRTQEIQNQIQRLSEQVKQLQNKRKTKQLNQQLEQSKMVDDKNKQQTINVRMLEAKEKRSKIAILHKDRKEKMCSILEQSRKQRECFLQCLREYVVLKHQSDKILGKGQKKQQKAANEDQKLKERIDRYLINLQNQVGRPKNKNNESIKRQYFEQSYTLNLLKEKQVQLDREYRSMQHKLKGLLDFFCYFNEEVKVVASIFFYGENFEFNVCGAKQQIHVLNNFFQYRQQQTFKKQKKRDNSILADFEMSQQFLLNISNNDSVNTQDQLEAKDKQLDDSQDDDNLYEKLSREMKILDFVNVCKKDAFKKFIGCLQILLKRTNGKISLKMVEQKVFDRNKHIKFCINQKGEIECDLKMKLKQLKECFSMILKQVRILTENNCPHILKDTCYRFYPYQVQAVEKKLQNLNETFSSYDKYFTSINEFWPSAQNKSTFPAKFLNAWKEQWQGVVSGCSLQIFLKGLLIGILGSAQKVLMMNDGGILNRLQQQQQQLKRVQLQQQGLNRQRQQLNSIIQQTILQINNINHNMELCYNKINQFSHLLAQQKLEFKACQVHFQIKNQYFVQMQKEFDKLSEKLLLEAQVFQKSKSEFQILQKFSNECSQISSQSLDLLEMNVKKQNKQKFEQQRRIEQNEIQIRKQKQKILKKQAKILNFQGRVKNTDYVTANKCRIEKESKINSLQLLIQKLEKHGKSKKTLTQIANKIKELQKCQQNKCSCGTNHNCDFPCKINCENQFCIKKAGHQGEHLCNSNNHKCSEKCEVNENCQNMCQQIMEHVGQHKCQSKHICQSQCNYCVKKCQKNLFDGHQKHQCLEKKCMKKCIFCDKPCSSLEHNHDDFAKKVVLKRKNAQTDIYESKQYRFHICEDEHECLSSCVHEGTCSILYKSEQKIWRKNQIETTYQYCEQTPTKNKCKLKIPPGKQKHQAPCMCTAIHTCTTRCPDCKGLCQKPFDHDASIPHQTTHRNQESLIYAAEDKNNTDFIQVQNENSKFFFSIGDESLPFKCNQSCKKKGRGHYHLIECKGGVDCFEKKYPKGVKHSTRVYHPHTDRNYDMFLCPYYWKQFNFTMPYENNEVTLCNFACTMQHSSNKMVFCSQEAWHSLSNDRSQHKFDCFNQHKKLTVAGLQICFLIDATGSMKDYIRECVEAIKKMVQASKKSVQRKNIKFAAVGYRDHKMTESKLFKRLHQLCISKRKQLQSLQQNMEYQNSQTTYSSFIEYISELQKIYRSYLANPNQLTNWSQKETFILKYHYPFILDVRSSRKFVDEKERRNRKKLRQLKGPQVSHKPEACQSLKSILLRRLDHYIELIQNEKDNEEQKSDVLKLIQSVEFSGSQACLKFFQNLKSSGGGDPPQAVLDGMDKAAKMNWTSNENIRRYIFHILDAPPHGEQYDCDNEDYFPEGCPCGLKPEQIIAQINKKNITYIIYPLTKVRIKRTLQRFGQMGLKYEVKDIKNPKDFSEHAAGLICHQIEQKQILIKK